MIDLNDLSRCKADIYGKYNELNNKYKEQIFQKNDDDALLDRHKIAACVCGAFLCVPVFNKTRLMQYMISTKQKMEVYFYYVNEMVAFFAASKFLSFFMVNDRKEQEDVIRTILRDFPKMPPVTKNKSGFWNSVIFNLSQIKDKDQIGLDHYDVYSYSMFFFWLESYFNATLPVTGSIDK